MRTVRTHYSFEVQLHLHTSNRASTCIRSTLLSDDRDPASPFKLPGLLKGRCKGIKQRFNISKNTRTTKEQQRVFKDNGRMWSEHFVIFLVAWFHSTIIDILCSMFTLRRTLKIPTMIKVYEFGPYDVHIYWNYTMEMRSVHSASLHTLYGLEWHAQILTGILDYFYK